MLHTNMMAVSPHLFGASPHTQCSQASAARIRVSYRRNKIDLQHSSRFTFMLL